MNGIVSIVIETTIHLDSYIFVRKKMEIGKSKIPIWKGIPLEGNLYAKRKGFGNRSQSSDGKNPT